MTTTPARVSVLVPPTMAAALAKLVADYAAAVGETPEECRRLVEVAVLTRGVRMMQEQVEAERKYAEKVGWK